ncbi:MAG: MarR family transcriptional regulator, partial [Ruthenibacterium sp.]
EDFCMEIQSKRALELFRQMDRTRKAWHNIAPCDDLSKSEFGTLMVIAHGGKAPFVRSMSAEETPCVITLSTLATVMGQSLPAISQRITAFEHRGFVERVADKTDRRVSGVRLTDAGLALMKKAQTAFAARLDGALEHLTDEEVDTLLCLLAKMADALEITTSTKAREND